MAPLCIGGSVVDTVPSFRYLGSVVESRSGWCRTLMIRLLGHQELLGLLKSPFPRQLLITSNKAVCIPSSGFGGFAVCG